MLERMHATSFDWLTWSGGGLTRLGLANRFEVIKSDFYIIKKYAIGFLESEFLLCRPKFNEIAVMFLKDEEYFWTHIRKEEFDYIFDNNKEG